jgi:septum formation protein
MRFVLASSSPRRRELLSMIGIDFDIVPSDVPEEHRAGERANDYVARLSQDKAEAIALQRRSDWVIAADTTVLLGDQLLEKPKDPADAARMISLIAGKTHFVYTGVTLQNVDAGYRETRVAETEVAILPLSSQDVQWYVDTGEPLGKAGAYAAQGIGAMFIDSIRGSYTNVVGLPLALLFQMMRNAGIDPLKD